MAELTPEMAAAGIFLDSTGMPTLPDGTPALWQNRAEAVPVQPGIRLDVGPEALAAQQPLGFGFGPPYNASGAYPESREPINLGFDVPDWQDYHTPNDFTTGGGFFTANDLAAAGRLPQSFASLVGNDKPSTNNYRLLPNGYNFPRYIMRNGNIIDMGNINMYGPFGPDSMGVDNPSWRSGIEVGMPSAWAQGSNAYSISGWPGQLAPFQTTTGFMGLGGAGP